MKHKEIIFQNNYWFVFLVIILCFSYVFILNAWVTDDAFITFRVVENFINGYGPVYNVGYRVQGYSHPLWFLLLSVVYYFFNLFQIDIYGDTLYFLSLSLSLLLSIATLYLLFFYISENKRNSVLGVVLLLMSKAFFDFTSSGLENPLSNFLLAFYIMLYFKDDLDNGKRILYLSIVASLGVLTRLDHLLIYFPSFLYLIWKTEFKFNDMIKLFLGWLPLIIWEIFSVIYYGLFVPNTAFAKINIDIPRSELMIQGLNYYLNSFGLDPVTLFAIIYILVVLLKNRRDLSFAAGIIFYMFYIIWIGGDFMSGRFLSILYFLSVLLITRIKFAKTMDYFMIFIIGTGVGLVSYHPPVFSDFDYAPHGQPYIGLIDSTGIMDERAWYYRSYGLPNIVSYKNSNGIEKVDWVYDADLRSVENIRVVGFDGYIAGPNVHVLDPHALIDPLLARIPRIERGYILMGEIRKWRSGHFERAIPNGYFESLQSDENLIQDEFLKTYYEKLKLVVSGDIYSIDRFIEIWRFNTGQNSYLIDSFLRTNP